MALDPEFSKAVNSGRLIPMAGLALSWGHIHVIAWPQVKDYSPAGLAMSFTF